MADLSNPRNYFGAGGADVTSSGQITRIMRRIRLVPQRGKMDCWVAASKMVLGYCPSVTLEMWASSDRQKGSEIGGLSGDDDTIQKFMKLNGLVMYPMSKWSLKGLENRLRTRSALLYPRGPHVVVVAGIEVNHRAPQSSKLIIYDPEPILHGKKEEVAWGKFIAGWENYRAFIKDDPEMDEVYRKRGWLGTGTYFLHR
jgi:hypothetical protein